LKLYFLNSKVGSSPLSNNFPPPIRSINILPPRMRDDDQNEMPVVVVFDRMPELEIESKYSIINIKYYLNVGDKPLPEGIWK
jgi:hypothetical protein